MKCVGGKNRGGNGLWRGCKNIEGVFDSRVLLEGRKEKNDEKARKEEKKWMEKELER